MRVAAATDELHRRLRRPRAQALRADPRRRLRARLERHRLGRRRASGSAGSPARPARSRGSTPSITPRTSRSTSPSIGCDVLLCSPYKFCGPHLGIGYLRAEAAERWRPYKARPSSSSPLGRRFETGTLPYELLAGFRATIAYLDSLGGLEVLRDYERDARRAASSASLPDERPALRPATWSAACRRSCSTSRASTAKTAAHALAERGIGVWYADNWYCVGARATGCPPPSLRVGLIHYNTAAEVDRLLDGARGPLITVDRFDAVIVGSGINSLACGALLARAGWSVCVLERNDWLGGAIKTAEITEPGFHHDVFSCLAPALGRRRCARGLLGDDLAARGLEYLNTELPDRHRLPGRRGRLPAAHGRRERRRARPACRRATAPRGRRCSTASCRTPTSRSACSAPSSGRERASRSRRRAARRLGRRGVAEFSGNVLVSSRDWLEETFASERAHGLLAPWVLHTGLGPDAAASGFMTQVIAVAIQEGGMPVPKGGGARLVDALVRLIEDNGGTCRTGAEVESIVVRDGAAEGVRTAGGETVGAERGRDRERHADPALRAAARQPTGPVADAGRRFRYGRAEMQIHFALSEPPRWDGDERLGEDGDRPRHPRSRRRLARRQRGRARPAARRGDGRVRPAARGRPEPRARGEGNAVDPAPGASLAREGRRGRRARRRRRHLDGGAARAVRRPDPGAARGAHPEPERRSSAHCPVAGRPAGGEPEPPPRRPLRRARSRSTRTSSGARSRRGRGTARRSTGSGTSAPAPGRARGSARAPGTIVALELLKAPASPSDPAAVPPPPLQVARTTVGRSLF